MNLATQQLISWMKRGWLPDAMIRYSSGQFAPDELSKSDLEYGIQRSFGSVQKELQSTDQN